MPSAEFAAYYPAVTVVAIIFIGVILIRQQRTIDRLTDKLMARDYREYMSMQPREEAPIQEEPARKPLSWHDDPLIEDDDPPN